MSSDKTVSTAAPGWAAGSKLPGPEWLARRRRENFAEDLTLLQQTFQERLAKQAPDDLTAVTGVVRADTVRAASRSAVADMISSTVQFLYKEIRGTLAFLIVIPWSVFMATAGPLWPWLGLLLAAFLLVVRGKGPRTMNTMAASGLLLGAASVGWLFYWPADGLSSWAALGLACSAVAVGLSIIAAAGRVNKWFARPDTSAVVLVLICAGDHAALRYHQATLGRSWWEVGLSLGLVLGLTLAALLSFLQFGLAVFHMARKLANMRMHSEAEFTESTLFTAAVVADGGGRAGVVSATEYLAAVLERGIAGVLCREDPVSAEFIRTELASRARHLRAIKRQVLFGRPGWRQDLLTWADSALLAAARRDWLALPSADSGEHTTTPTRPVVRVGRIVLRSFVVLLPVAVLAAAWWSGMAIDAILPAALPFVVAWMAVQIGELMRPGTSADMSKSASSTDTGASLIQNVSQLFTRSG